jgi:hypothetical protein
MKTTTTGHKINQAQGPRTGNEGTPSKRKAFNEAKATTGNERASIANMVTSALEMRGRGQRGHDDPALESMHDNTGPKTNPTANGSKLPGKYKSPKKIG